MNPTEAPVPRTWILGEADVHVRTALDHVLLGLSYLGETDVDGYLSLLHPDVVVALPGGRVLTGHDEVGGEVGRAIRPVQASGVVAVARCVVVAVGTARVPDGPGRGDVPVVDLYVLDRDGLIRSCHRVRTGRG